MAIKLIYSLDIVPAFFIEIFVSYSVHILSLVSAFLPLSIQLACHSS
jgi:hypothetical protein